MSTFLPTIIAAFFRAYNAGETADFNQLFTPDALVNDEAHEYRGAAIKVWLDRAIAKYKSVAAIADVAEVGGHIIATAQVSGNFPGSPAQIRYRFTLRDDKIAALDIGTEANGYTPNRRSTRTARVRGFARARGPQVTFVR